MRRLPAAVGCGPRDLADDPHRLGTIAFARLDHGLLGSLHVATPYLITRFLDHLVEGRFRRRADGVAVATAAAGAVSDVAAAAAFQGRLRVHCATPRRRSPPRPSPSLRPSLSLAVTRAWMSPGSLRDTVGVCEIGLLRPVPSFTDHCQRRPSGATPLQLGTQGDPFVRCALAAGYRLKASPDRVPGHRWIGWFDHPGIHRVPDPV